MTRFKDEKSASRERAGVGGPAPGVTLKDVAALAAVHTSTASRALNGLQAQRISPATVERVRAAAQHLGYMPHPLAVGLRRRRTNTIGVIVSDFENPYSARLIRGISEVMDERGFLSLVAESIEDSGRFESVLRHFLSRRVDAIITTAAHLGDTELLSITREAGVPVVLAGRNLPDSGFPAVMHDDFAGGRLAAAHLLEFRHEVVAQLLGPADIDTFKRRCQGFQSRLAGRDLADVTLPIHAGAPSLEEGRRLMKLALRGDRLPTGVFAHNDQMAVGALEALEAAGLSCPRDISIVGYNDVPLSDHLSPPLTTIRSLSDDLGRCAAQIALQIIEDWESQPADVRLPAMLVVRRSTGPPPRRLVRHG